MTGRARRRDRRLARAARRQAEFDSHVQAPEPREGLASDVLQNPKAVTSDLALVKKSLRWGKKTRQAKRDVVERLHELVKKRGVQRLTKDGELIIDEEVADKNAIAASSLIVAIESQQQKDEHLERRIHSQNNPQKSTTIQVGVHVDNRMDERRSRTRALIERAGAERGIQLTPSGGSPVVIPADGST